MDGQTDDGAFPSYKLPGAFGSGELKTRAPQGGQYTPVAQ